MCESQRLSWLEVIYKYWIVLNNDNGGQNSQSVPVSCEMKKWFGDISFSVILRIVVGKLSDEAEEKRMEAVKAMRDMFKLTGEFVISDVLPYLGWLDLGGKEKAMKKIAKELYQFLQFWVDEHRYNRDTGSGQAKPKHNNFMDMLLSLVDEVDKIDGHNVNTVIKATSLVSPSLVPLILFCPFCLYLVFNLVYNPNIKYLTKEHGLLWHLMPFT